MVVQHNLTAMNSNRMLGLTMSSQAKSTEKLSSGYKINRAADDAAGLSISEKMRRQIRGLTQASLNAQDGISAVQTAEGALTEVHDMLQRMDELATKAANGTLTEEDRKAVQDEIDQLVTEIDRVSETTTFNEMALLKGDPEKTVTTTERVVTSELAATYANPIEATITIDDTGFDGDDDVNGTNTGYYLAGSDTALTGADLADLLEVKDGAIALKEGVAVYTEAADTAGQFGAQVTDANEAFLTVIADYVTINNNALYDKTTNAEVTEEDLVNYFNADGTYKGGLMAYNDANALTDVGAEQIDNFVTVTEEQYEEKTDTLPAALEFNLHVGAESDTANKIQVTIESMSAKNIGIDVLKTDGVMTEDSATAAIDVIKAAISKVSEQRSTLGAAQNRLEHTINNLDNVVENTTSAESQIRDTDMATEMVKYSNNQILAQAGQAMLAQSNQANQGVLALLQ